MTPRTGRIRGVAGAARRAILGAPEPWPSRLPEAWVELRHLGIEPLGTPERSPGGALRLAFLLPSFRHASGGHQTVVHLARELTGRNHHVSLWLEDTEGRRGATSATTQRFVESFGASGLEFHADLADWQGADVVVATGWQTAARALRLPGTRGRAYLVQDHEPEFYPTSAEALLAADSYRLGLPCIAASRWLAELLRERYGAEATSFELAVDHTVYAPGEAPSAPHAETVAFYARAETPRRALPLGLLALEELSRRRPAVRIDLFGNVGTTPPRFAHEQHSTLTGPRLAALFRRATVGLSLSLTNPSLIPLEMMACGLPCVELASDPMRATFGSDGPLALTDPDPLALCEAIEDLLDIPSERARRSDRGLAMMRERTWASAAGQVEEQLRSVPR